MEAPVSKPKRTKRTRRTPEQKEARKAARLAAATSRESSEQSEDTREPAALLPDVSGPDDPDDGLLGLSSLRNKVTESVYIDLLTLAAAAQAKLVAAQTEAQKQVHQAMKMKEKVKLLGEKAEKARAEGKLEAAMTQVKLAKQKARADKLQVNLTKSNTQRLALIGHVDLRAILDDVLPKSKKDEPLKLWLQSEQDRRHVRSAAHATGGREHQPPTGAFSAFRLMGTTLLLCGRVLLTACLAFADLCDALPS